MTNHRRESLATVLLGLAIAASLLASPYRVSAATLPPSPNDLIVLASQWWGVTYAQFPTVAQLQPGDYSAGDDPGSQINSTHAGFKVIVPVQNRTASKWPGPLVPFAFEFSPKDGLAEVIGFFGLNSNEAEFVASLSKVYGPPEFTSQAFSMITYAWLFDKSTLTVNTVGFYITPKGQGAF